MSSGVGLSNRDRADEPLLERRVVALGAPPTVRSKPVSVVSAGRMPVTFAITGAHARSVAIASARKAVSSDSVASAWLTSDSDAISSEQLSSCVPARRRVAGLPTT